MEALSNWFPNKEDRGYYDLNNKVMAEERSVDIWKAGYLNALVPSELIEMNKLDVDEKGRAVMNGHHFDAVLYLHPQYAKESQVKFLEKLVAKGGKLMIEGDACYNFEGKDISKRFDAVLKKATVRGYSIEALPRLGLQKNALQDGCKSEDGVYVFTHYESLMGNEQATFKVEQKGHVFEGTYKGLAAISFDAKGNVKKFAGTGIAELKKDGQTIFSLPEPTDVYYENSGKLKQLILADSSKEIKPRVNQLF